MSWCTMPHVEVLKAHEEVAHVGPYLSLRQRRRWLAFAGLLRRPTVDELEHKEDVVEVVIKDDVGADQFGGGSSSLWRSRS